MQPIAKAHDPEGMKNEEKGHPIAHLDHPEPSSRSEQHLTQNALLPTAGPTASSPEPWGAVLGANRPRSEAWLCFTTS